METTTNNPTTTGRMTARQTPRPGTRPVVGNEFAEKARLVKATHVADFLTAMFGAAVDPTDEGCRLAAAILVAAGILADRPFSDLSCETVRTILATRRSIVARAAVTDVANNDDPFAGLV